MAADLVEGDTGEVEPVAADLVEGDTGEVEPVAADLVEGDTGEVEPVAADLVEGDTGEVEPVAADLVEGDTGEVEPVAADLVEGGTGEVEPAAADLGKSDTARAGLQNDDTVRIPAVPAVPSGGRHQPAQLPEQPVLGPEPVQTPAKKRRSGYLALAATALVALLIGALLFSASRDRGATAQSVPTVTTSATATVTKPTSEQSDESTASGETRVDHSVEGFAGPCQAFRSGSNPRYVPMMQEILFCGCSAWRVASGWTFRNPPSRTRRASSLPLSS